MQSNHLIIDKAIYFAVGGLELYTYLTCTHIGA